MTEIKWDEPEALRGSDIVVGLIAFVLWAAVVGSMLRQIAAAVF